jgi:hypothetical protein
MRASCYLNKVRSPSLSLLRRSFSYWLTFNYASVCATRFYSLAMVALYSAFLSLSQWMCLPLVLRCGPSNGDGTLTLPSVAYGKHDSYFIYLTWWCCWVDKMTPDDMILFEFFIELSPVLWPQQPPPIRLKELTAEQWSLSGCCFALTSLLELETILLLKPPSL